MKQRMWTNEQKMQIVLCGLRGQNISEICNENGIKQAQYYKWREQFLSNAAKAFDAPRVSNEQVRLQSENQRLKAMIGELTLELKKTEQWL